MDLSLSHFYGQMADNPLLAIAVALTVFILRISSRPPTCAAMPRNTCWRHDRL